MSESPVRDREQAKKILEAWMDKADALRQAATHTGERLVQAGRCDAFAQVLDNLDALLPQPNPEGGDAHDAKQQSGSSRRDVAQVGDGAESVPGQPDPQPMVSEEWANSSEHPNWEAGWNAGYARGRHEAERAEESLRAARAVVEAEVKKLEAERDALPKHDRYGIEPGAQHRHLNLSNRITRLRTVLSSHPEQPEPDSGIPQ